MNVYVLTECWYDGDGDPTVVGVYSTLAQAQAAAPSSYYADPSDVITWEEVLMTRWLGDITSLEDRGYCIDAFELDRVAVVCK